MYAAKKVTGMALSSHQYNNSIKAAGKYDSERRHRHNRSIMSENKAKRNDAGAEGVVSIGGEVCSPAGGEEILSAGSPPAPYPIAFRAWR